MIIACIISFIVGSMLIMCAIGMVAIQKDKKPRNKVHFYVARNKNGELNVYLNKPLRNKENGYWYQYNYIINKQNSILIWVSTRITNGMYFCDLGLNLQDFKNLKWEDEPVEVFLNLDN